MISSERLTMSRASFSSVINRQTILLLVDLIAIIAGFALVLGLLDARPSFDTRDQLEPLRLAILALITASLVTSFEWNGHYQERRPFWQEAGEVVLAFGAALLADAALLFFFQESASRLTVLGYWTVGCALLLTGRTMAKSWLRARGMWTTPAVIIGTGQNARDLAVALLDDPVPAYRPQAFVSLTPGGPTTIAVDEDTTLPVVDLGDNPFEIVHRFRRAHIVAALELEDFVAGRPLIERLSRAHKDIEIVLPLRGLPTRRSYQTRYVNHDLTTIRLPQQLEARWQTIVKRGFDLAGATAIMLFIAPLFFLIAASVLTTGRPVFFAHERIGRHGRPFRCLKFRTMAVDAQARLEHILGSDPAAAEEWRLTRKLKNDPRVTSIGSWLRKTSLDELPQFLNVLRGDMSLVGPRPVTREEVEEYGEDKVHYLQVRPGITGLWQVSGRNQVDFRRRVHLDTWYVQNWSLMRDITILLMTVRVVLARQGAY